MSISGTMILKGIILADLAQGCDGGQLTVLSLSLCQLDESSFFSAPSQFWDFV